MKRVGAVLKQLEGKGALRKRLAEARALEQWPDLVGPHLAQRTRPLRVAGERLFVVAHGASLRQELTFHKSTILRRLNRAAGDRIAREVVFLESDAQLSSLVEREPPEEERPRVPEIEREELDEEDMPAEDEILSPVGPAYETFDAVAYRRRLRRLAQAPSMSRGEPREKPWETQ